MCKVDINKSKKEKVYPQREVVDHRVIKTKLCRNFFTSNFCKFGELCDFAHNIDDVYDNNETCRFDARCSKFESCIRKHPSREDAHQYCTRRQLYPIPSLSSVSSEWPIVSASARPTKKVVPPPPSSVSSEWPIVSASASASKPTTKVTPPSTVLIPSKVVTMSSVVKKTTPISEEYDFSITKNEDDGLITIGVNTSNTELFLIAIKEAITRASNKKSAIYIKPIDKESVYMKVIPEDKVINIQIINDPYLYALALKASMESTYFISIKPLC